MSKQTFINGLVTGIIAGCIDIKSVPNRALFASGNSWYRGSVDKSNITAINIVDTYTPSGFESQKWSCDKNHFGSITCYITDTTLTIAGNGCGKLYANPNSSRMFYGFTSVTNITGLELLDTSEVTDMSNMFLACYSLTAADLSNFNTSNVTTMLGMFTLCGSLTTLDLSHFNTSNVTNMTGMFNGCSSLTTLDLSNFDTSNVTNMAGMFRGLIVTVLDLHSFDMSNVINTRYMFYSSVELTTINVSNKWVISENCDTTDMFTACGVSEVTYVN